MNAILCGATRAEAVYRSWVDNPDLDPRQVTHAVRSGATVALCGVTTGAQGGAWPECATAWESPMKRCGVCEQCVYGTAERW